MCSTFKMCRKIQLCTHLRLDFWSQLFSYIPLVRPRIHYRMDCDCMPTCKQSHGVGNLVEWCPWRPLPLCSPRCCPFLKTVEGLHGRPCLGWPLPMWRPPGLWIRGQRLFPRHAGLLSSPVEFFWTPFYLCQGGQTDLDFRLWWEWNEMATHLEPTEKNQKTTHCDYY